MRARFLLLSWTIALSVIGFGFTWTGSMATAEMPQCDRECLIGFIDRFLDALVKHDAKALPLAEGVKYTENGEPMKLGEGLWKTAAGVKYKQYFADPSTGQAAFFGVIEEGGSLAIFALRLKIVSQKITEIETIVSRKGAHALFSPEALVTPKPIYDQILSRSERSSRAKMIEVANSYFNGIEQHNGDIVPFHTLCNRTENGVRTTNNRSRNFDSSCKAGLNRLVYIPTVRDRRFPIVDEERGLVLSFIVFDMPGNIATAVIDGRTVELTESQRRKRSLLLAELFKIVGGQIREIEAFMINRPLGAPSGWPN
jgi:hypothetical protein